MSASRAFPETLVRLVADVQTRLAMQPSEDHLVLPRAVLIRPGDTVPEVFRRSYETVIADTPGLPYTVFLPAYQGLQNTVSGKLICCLGTDIHVLEDDKGRVTSACYPLGRISFVEVGKILLYSWIRLHGQAADGGATVVEFQFNTVTDYVLSPIVEWVRAAAPISDTDGRGAGRDDFDYLQPINIKLSNYSRRSVAPGDRVVRHVYQPAIRVESFRLLGFPLFKKRANPHVVILTDKELILIQDGDFKRFGKNAIYAGIWHYIPLDKIVSISIAATTDNLLAMSVILPAGGRIECLFSASQRPDLELLISQFEPVSARRIAAPAV